MAADEIAAPVSTIRTDRVGVPGNVAIVNATTTSVSLSWLPEAGFQAPIGYNVYLGTSYIATTLDPAYTINGLDRGQSYRVLLTAFDADGRYSVSSEATLVTTLAEAASPAEPASNEPPVSDSDASEADASEACLLYTSPSPRDATLSRMPSSA